MAGGWGGGRATWSCQVICLFQRDPLMLKVMKKKLGASSERNKQYSACVSVEPNTRRLLPYALSVYCSYLSHRYI